MRDWECVVSVRETILVSAETEMEAKYKALLQFLRWREDPMVECREEN